jgi:hypothetical protein
MKEYRKPVIYVPNSLELSVSLCELEQIIDEVIINQGLRVMAIELDRDIMSGSGGN